MGSKNLENSDVTVAGHIIDGAINWFTINMPPHTYFSYRKNSTSRSAILWTVNPTGTVYCQANIVVERQRIF